MSSMLSVAHLAQAQAQMEASITKAMKESAQLPAAMRGLPPSTSKGSMIKQTLILHLTKYGLQQRSPNRRLSLRRRATRAQRRQQTTFAS